MKETKNLRVSYKEIVPPVISYEKFNLLTDIMKPTLFSETVRIETILEICGMESLASILEIMPKEMWMYEFLLEVVDSESHVFLDNAEDKSLYTDMYSAIKAYHMDILSDDELDGFYDALSDKLEDDEFDGYTDIFEALMSASVAAVYSTCYYVAHIHAFSLHNAEDFAGYEEAYNSKWDEIGKLLTKYL
jgi:hypothetical protein